jgi:hypothetical protein
MLRPDLVHPKHWIHPQLKDLIRNKIIILDGEKYRITPSLLYYLNTYIVFKRDPLKKCLLWKDIYFEKWGVIPRFCREHCYKAYVPFDTVEQMFAYFEFFKTGKFDFYRKIGPDKRPYTPWDYFAVGYAHTLRDAENLLDRMISIAPNNCKVKPHTVKACTEMKMKVPQEPPESWTIYGEANQEFEDYLDQEVFYQEYIEAAGGSGTERSHWERIQCDWLRHAKKIGDMTYKNVVGDIPINP